MTKVEDAVQIADLAYSIVTATNPVAWARFGEDFAGFAAHPVSGGIALRMDERAGRIFMEKGAADCYSASGWELRTRRAFDEALAELARKKVAFTPSTEAERAFRHVSEMVWFHDPSGNRHELFHGPVSDFRRFVSPQGVTGFVTGNLGYGHVVLPAPQIDTTRDFLVDVLNFGVSDFMVHRPCRSTLRRYWITCPISPISRRSTAALVLSISRISTKGRSCDRASVRVTGRWSMAMPRLKPTLGTRGQASCCPAWRASIRR